MIERIIYWSLHNRAIVLIATIFLFLWGLWALERTPVDAIPDLSDNQVIVMTDWMGRAPQLVEDQVTYPLQSALKGLPRTKAVRGLSMFGISMIYVIFDDDVDIYWARSRVMEKLSEVQGFLPPGAKTQLGPDGTGVGHVYWYTVEGDGYDLAQLRTIQDWYLKTGLASVEGVSEIASIGGFVKQYQIELDPLRMQAFNVSTMMVMDAVRNSNIDVGGGLIERSSMEYLIRSLGYIKSKSDIENVVIMANDRGVPVTVADVATVQMGGDIRRGLLDKNGEGEVVGGIIVMRYGEHAGEVIDRVKARLKDLSRGLPEGVHIEMAYDRSDLIDRAIDTLKETLFQETAIVCLVIMLFLFHFRSAVVVIAAIPIAVVSSFIAMYYFSVTSNLMSLAGIAIAIGVLDDASITVMENAYRHLSLRRGGGTSSPPLSPPIGESHPPLEGGLSVRSSPTPLAESLPPLEGGLSVRPSSPPLAESLPPLEGGLSVRSSPTPLAESLPPLEGGLSVRSSSPPLAGDDDSIISVVYASCRTVGRPIFFSMGIIVLSFIPVFLLEGQEGKLFFPLAMTKTAAMVAVALLAITLIPVLCTFLLKGKLRPEESNPLNRFFNALYEPIIRFALRFKWQMIALNVLVLIFTGWLATRIGSEFMPALDEGSLLFMPTTLPNVSITEAKRIMQVQDKIIKSTPEVDLVLGKVGRAETATDPAPVSMIETIILLKPHDQWRKGLTRDDIIAELDGKLQIPGVANGWTQPIINRINMLATGVRTDLGIKIYGPDLKVLEELAIKAEHLVKPLPGAVDVFAERVIGGNYIDIVPDRVAIARYGLTIGEVQSAIEAASGGMNVTTTVEGRERYPVRVRYARDFRQSPEELGNILLTSMSGAQVPLSQVATIDVVNGPAMIASENGLPRSVVFLNVRGRDMGSFVEEAKGILHDNLSLPPGYFIEWSGQWEHQVRAKERLAWIVPIGLAVIFILLYFIFHSFVEAGLVMLSVPFSLTGGVLFIYWMGYNWSVAVWVGFIALYGVAVETGVVMVVYLQEALDKRLAEGVVGRKELYEAIYEGAVTRLRPKLMSVATTILGLLPILWSTGTGADLMKPIASPMVGGLFTSAVHVLIVTPVIFALVKERELKKGPLKPANIDL